MTPSNYLDIRCLRFRGPVTLGGAVRTFAIESDHQHFSFLIGLVYDEMLLLA